jgi:chorismate mutase/prephenate dehydratase
MRKGHDRPGSVPGASGRAACIEDVRADIDRIDAELVRLLNERAARAVRIGEMKKKQGDPVCDPEREEHVLERVKQLNRGPLSESACEAIYRRIMAACVEVQTRRRAGAERAGRPSGGAAQEGT